MSFQCSICSQELKQDAGRASCFFCGNEEEADYACPQGHYVCEDCRTACPEEMVERVASATHLQDPLAIASLIMSHVSFSTAGPEHHLVVAPAALAALRNSGAGQVQPGAIHEAITHSRGVPLGACASRGDCGGATGAGIAVSIVSGATPQRGRERSMVLRASANTALALAEMGGRRCCKQAVFCGIEVAWEGIRSSFVPSLPALPKHTCGFSDRQPDCKRKACPYHG